MGPATATHASGASRLAAAMSQEQLMDCLKKTGDMIYANFVTLKEAGLFKFEHILTFF